ncbi:hypothetical protein C7212DRAFT_335584 [Tuber magnatum]|uniref:Uncharacterized protein n=1 Tax=Tuber magnatum TaxID=42249 RepID=A0A317SER4_9PEZI|nr:hypothetical protein C7212DRAFT_335584 [Tuber magnatum]
MRKEMKERKEEERGKNMGKKKRVKKPKHDMTIQGRLKESKASEKSKRQKAYTKDRR